MSLPATLIIIGLGVWMLASLCFVFRVPPVHTMLKRLNWFRTFAHWTMFAASPNPRIRPGAFAVEYRDGPDDAWLTAIDGHHWSPFALLLNPRRLLAARVHHLGQIFAALREQSAEPDVAAGFRLREAVIASYLRRTRPLAAGRTRSVRVVKRFGRADPAAGELAWQFTIRADE
jgi:hypothetical protein